MKQSFGSIYMFNFIIFFIVIVFAFIMGIISYNRAFKVNSRIINEIETHEGYNRYAIEEINRVLGNLGYKTIEESNYGQRNGYELVTDGGIDNGGYDYCIYRKQEAGTAYVTYLVTTYIYMDVPIVGDHLKLPVSSHTNRIYIFSEENK